MDSQKYGVYKIFSVQCYGYGSNSNQFDGYCSDNDRLYLVKKQEPVPIYINEADHTVEEIVEAIIKEVNQKYNPTEIRKINIEDHEVEIHYF